MVGRVALVHNRLAIIDLVTGDQPLFAGPATLVANGEIYNYRELRAAMPEARLRHQQRLRAAAASVAARRRRLRARSCAACSPSPSTSAQQRTVTLTRDPFGIKPLYIAQIADGLAFASEPQALLAAGLVRPRGAPRRARRTAATAVHHRRRDDLRGHPARAARRDAHLRRRPHHRAPPHLGRCPRAAPETIAEDAALARLDRALEESVDLHQRSDVPYGMFLSGGIDSATLLTLMARLNNQPVLAFTAGFDVPGAADEREHAAAVAQGARRPARDHR